VYVLFFSLFSFFYFFSLLHQPERHFSYFMCPGAQVHVVTDGNLISGQNPRSADAVGAAVAALVTSKQGEESKE
jgi:hypothetical protein